MGIFNPGTGTGGVRASAQRYDVLIGILGVFALMSTIQAVVFLAQGSGHAADAVVLAVVVGAVLAWAIRRRRSLGV